MKKLLAFTLIFALLFSMSSMAFATTENEEVRKTDTAPTIDGQIDDIWADVEAFPLNHYTIPKADNAELDPVKEADDLSGQWRGLWDDDYFYFLVEVTDNVVNNLNYSAEGNKLDDDHVRILIGQEGNNHIIFGVHAHSGETVFTFLGPDGPDAWADRAEGTQATSQIVDGGYVIEAAIPWSSAGSETIVPAPGTELKIEIQAWDNDYNENQLNEIGVETLHVQSRLNWSNTEHALPNSNPSTENLGTITLLSADGSSNGGSTDSGSSEGTGGGSTTPSMPQTGMGGASNGMATASWAMLVVFIAAIGVVGFRQLRRN